MLNNKKIKLLSLQPCSFFVNGGAARLLRRIYEDRADDVVAIYPVNSSNAIQSPKSDRNLQEEAINIFPMHQPWMRWKLRSLIYNSQDTLFFRVNLSRVVNAISKFDFEILHIINQNSVSNVTKAIPYLSSKKIWVSFHDYYQLAGVSKKDTLDLWERADRRLVISQELAKKYCREFGLKEYEIITDGLRSVEISQSKIINPKKFIVYFSGLLHLEYYKAFEVFADALDEIGIKAQIQFILRGTQELSFLNNRNFSVEYRKNFISDEELKAETDLADILYLPLKFDHPLFSKYSLSTKMVSYLGAKGAIFYHGPKESAVGSLLEENNAASLSFSLEKNQVKNSLLYCIDNSQRISNNAKILAREQFDLESIKARFWEQKFRL